MSTDTQSSITSRTPDISVVGREIRFYCRNDVSWRAIHEATRIKNPQAFFLKRKHPRNPFYRKWDGYVRSVDREWNGPGIYSCPLGLYGRLAESEAQFLVGFMDAIRPFLVVQDPAPFLQLLRDKLLSAPQQEVCELLLRQRLASIQFKTGSGKTEVMINAAACELCYRPDSVFLVLVPNRNLLHQTYERFQDGTKGLLRMGIAGDSKLELDANVVIATPHTISELDLPEGDEFLARVTHAVVDEGHHQSSGLWAKATDRCPLACLHGLSGKLQYERADNRQKQHTIEAQFGPLLLESEAAERRCPVVVNAYHPKAWPAITAGLPSSIRDGVKAAFKLDGEETWIYGIYHGLNEMGKPSQMCMTTDAKGNLKVDKKKFGVYMRGKSGKMELIKPSQMQQNSLVYQTAHDVGIMEYKWRNQWAVALATSLSGKEEPWLMTVTKLRHVDRLTALLQATGVSFGVVSGDCTSGENREALRKFAAREVSGLLAIYQSVSEGVDIPGLLHLIKLDGQTGEQLLTQQDGRVARIAEGKTHGTVHVPIDLHSTTLAKNSRRIVKYLKDAGSRVEKIVV